MYLKVGMRVKLSDRAKKHWQHSNDNPHDVYGDIVYVFTDEELAGEEEWLDGFADEDNHFPYGVDWDNGRTNSYRWLDLDPLLPLPNKSLEDYL
jgi:hypothetical protein